MLYNYKEAIVKFKMDYNLKKEIENNKIYKIKEGIYSDIPYPYYLSILKKNIHIV